MVDDEVLEKYINGLNIDGDLLAQKKYYLTHDCKLFPVIGGSALIDVGVEDLVGAIYKFIPATSKNLNSDLSAYVFMIRVDENGKNAFVKILNGNLKNRDTVSVGENKLEKVKNITVADGTKMIPVD